MPAPILRTADFRRIEQLPRRDVKLSMHLGASLQSELRQEDAGGAGQNLWPIQLAALYDIRHEEGLLGCIGVGHGKTIISLLAASVTDCKRPLLLVPASLKKVTIEKRIPNLQKSWKVREDIRVESYHAISNNPALLAEYKPDLIVADECHKLARTQSARTKRLLRYVDANPGTKFVGLSGTITRKSLRDYWHLALAALKEGAPLPLKWHEMGQWALALDHGVSHFERPPVGALKLFTDEAAPTLDEARAGFRERLVDTPGIIATSDSAVGASLVIVKRTIDVHPDMDEALRNLRQQWVTPGGEEVTEAVDYWRKAREISSGFYYRWEWGEAGPDQEWLDARAEWRRYVRSVTRRTPRMDTEGLVKAACENGELLSADYMNWMAVKDRANPTTVPVWFTHAILRDAIDEARNGGAGHTVLWFEQRAVGQRLRELSGWPLFDGDGAALESHIENDLGPCIASIKAHGTGNNLQGYSQGTVITPPSSGATWEQLLGRMHRPGQQSDEVTITVYQHTEELRDAIENAIGGAGYIQTSTGQRQKLLYASFVE